MTATRSIQSRLAALEALAPHDSYIVAVQTEPQTIGKTFEKLTGFEVGPQNFDLSVGLDVRVCEDLDGIDVLTAGRYHIFVNCQLADPSSDGWFEPAVQPNGLELAEELFPGDITVGHVGVYVPAAAAGWDEVVLGATAGYTAPKLDAGALVTAWARFGSASGTDTVDVQAILYANRVTA